MIGSRIKARREQVGLTQSQLGAALRVSSQQIQKYEVGRNRVAASQIALLAKALDVPSTFFFMTGAEAWIDGEGEAHRRMDEQSQRLLNVFDAIGDAKTRQAIVSIVETIAAAFDGRDR